MNNSNQNNKKSKFSNKSDDLYLDAYGDPLAQRASSLIGKAFIGGIFLGAMQGYQNGFRENTIKKFQGKLRTSIYSSAMIKQGMRNANSFASFFLMQSFVDFILNSSYVFNSQTGLQQLYEQDTTKRIIPIFITAFIFKSHISFRSQILHGFLMMLATGLGLQYFEIQRKTQA